jgi:hypothetical protein
MSEGSEAADSVEVPAPLALHDYFRLLDDFASSKPCRNAYIGELLDGRDWGDRERTEYEQGQSALWRLIPPITLDELKEADFDPPANIALALAVVVWGRHALHHSEGRMPGRRMPAPLPQIERLARHIAESLEQAGRKSSRGGIGRLDALRLELQEVRTGLEASARAREQAADGVQDGIASARRSDSLSPALRWLPKRFRKATQPGLDAFRRITSPGVAVSMITGEFSMATAWNVDPQVPEPLGVYDYVQALGDHGAGKRLQHVFLHGLIQSVGLTDELLGYFEAGRNGLWILIPPITATQVAEADLSVDAARALGVALFLRINHGLHHYSSEQPDGGIPRTLLECGEMLTVIKLVLDSGRSAEEDPVIKALTDVAVRLAARGVSAGGIVDQRMDQIREVRRQDAEQRREAAAEEEAFVVETQASQQRLTFSMVRGTSLPRLIAGALLVGLLGFVAVTTRPPTSNLPEASAYKAVPAIAIIRHRDEIIVRVPPHWLRQAKLDREASLRSLYARFAKELDPEPLPILIVGLKNQPYGGVAGQRVWWDASTEEPTPTPTPEETPPSG